VKRPCVKMVEIAAQIWAKRAELEWKKQKNR
jgi:hypothetical protein